PTRPHHDFLVPGLHERVPELELLALVPLDPCPMRGNVPAARCILEPGLGARSVMPEGPFHNGGMEDRDRAQEVDGSLRGVAVDGVLYKVVNLVEQTMFIDKPPMPPQPRVGRMSQRAASRICEVGGRMHERRDTITRGMCPGLRHEIPVEIRLSSRHLRIHCSG